MEALHVHIGPGRLGVGLILDVANRAKLTSHLVGRRGSEAAVGRFGLELTGEEPRRLDCVRYSEGNSVGDLQEHTREALGRPVPLLITTSVGAGLVACGPLLREIAMLRRGLAQETVLIACENNPGGAYEQLREDLGRLGVRCRATMVNRLCPDRKVVDGQMVVRADPYAEWMIERGGEKTVEMLDAIDCVSLVAEVTPFATRKRWLCNGVHIGLGVFARGVGQPSIRAIAHDPDRRAQVDQLQEDMVGALDGAWAPVLGDSLAYGRLQLAPMCRTEDDTSRILARLQRARLAPFLDDANRKIGEPARLRVEMDREGRLPASFEDLFDELHNLLLNIDHYEDGRQVRKREVRLSANEDAAATEAYDRLLLGIVADAERQRRCDQLARRLKRHHLVFGHG